MSPMDLAAVGLALGPAGVGLMLASALAVAGVTPLQAMALAASLAVLELLSPEEPE